MAETLGVVCALRPQTTQPISDCCITPRPSPKPMSIATPPSGPGDIPPSDPTAVDLSPGSLNPTQDPTQDPTQESSVAAAAIAENEAEPTLDQADNQAVNQATEPETVPEFVLPSLDRHECRACGYVYEPADGDGRTLTPGTLFQDIPGTWSCPVCRAPKIQFINIGPKEKPSGFQENLTYGLGGNVMTPSQKRLLIFGSLVVAFLFLMSFYGFK